MKKSLRDRSQEKVELKRRTKILSFFTSCLLIYRIENYVETMVIVNREISGNEQLRMEVRDYFNKLYREKMDWRPSLDGVKF